MSEHYFSSYYPNRVICAVFDEMRKLNETRNYSALLSLIEEAQMLANRMEAKLHDVKDRESLNEDIAKLKKELKALRKEKKEITDANEIS